MWRPLFVVVVLLLVAGCSRNTFVGQRLGNFTAYYNTFYNAEKAYDEGVKAITTSADQEAVDRNVYLPLFGSEGRSAQTQAFESAIQKSSDILRDHPNSKWVDDALLLIGKSYFYLQNYVGAERKFREVETLDSPLEDEARFWLARTYIASVQYDLAANHLEESLIREDLSKQWEPQLRLALGSLYVKRQAWEAAIAELETGLENVRDKDLAARAQFLLGQVYETLGRYDEAVAAYEAVGRYNPLYELSYAAQIEAVRVEGMHGDTEAALRQLRRMERDDKNYENRAELAYLRGRLYQASGRPEEALDAYYALLYDSDANITEVRGRTHYALGEFYRDVYADYPLAAAHFDTASTNLGGGGKQLVTSQGGARQEALAPAAITDAVEQARTFGSFAEVIGNVSHMDSLLYLGSLDDESFQEIVLELRRQRAEELAKQQEAIARRQAEQQFAGNNFDTQGGQRNQPAPTTGAEASSDGFLYHKNPIQVQENLANFELRWGERPLVPNWRRIEAVQGIGSADTEDRPDAPAGIDPALVEQAALPDVDISNVPRDSLSQAEMRAQRAMARYELGNVLFLSMGRPDSAAVWYRMVIEEDSDERVAQRAYYALAEVQRALGDTLASNRLYEIILDQYPTSEFSARARERLGRVIEAPTDSLALAEAAYYDAYTTWQRDNYRTSLNDMIEVAVRYRETPVAPRALLAAGSVYMEWATRDSLSLFDPLPLTVSDSLLLEGGLLKVKPKPLPTPIDSAAAQPNAVPSDTLAAPSENLGAAPDTLAMPDHLAVPSDSTREEREANEAVAQNLPSDSLAAVPQRSLLPADTTGMRPDSLAAMEAMADTTAIEYEPVRLETLYNTLTTEYPQAPQTAQARRVLNALKERQAAIQAVADSLAASEQAIADSVAAAQLPAADTTATPEAVVPDSVTVSPPTAQGETEVEKEAEEEKGNAMEAVGSVLRDKELRDNESRMLPDSARTDSIEGRKARLQDMLNRRQQNPEAQPADSAQAAPPDSTRIDTSQDASQMDSTAVARQPEPAHLDTTVAAPVPPPVAQAKAPRARGLTAEERAQGGWTIIVASEGSQREAELRLPLFRTRLQEAGYPVDIFAALGDDPPRYRIGVGLFASQKEAASAQARLTAQLPEDAWVLKVVPME